MVIHNDGHNRSSLDSNRYHSEHAMISPEAREARIRIVNFMGDQVKRPFAIFEEDEIEHIVAEAIDAATDKGVKKEKAATLCKNDRDQWVPAIPLPYYEPIGTKRCGCCGAVFLTEKGYQGHYALKHILHL